MFQFQEGDQGAQYDPGNKLAKIYERGVQFRLVAFRHCVKYWEWSNSFTIDLNNMQSD